MIIADADYLTGRELTAALLARGVSIPESTLRKWREKKLLPAARRGGEARFPAISVDQAIAANTLSLRKKRSDFIGWHLWLQGYDVGEFYWKPIFLKAGKARFGALRKIARFLNSRDETEIDTFESGIIDQARANQFPAPLSGHTRRMNTDDKAAIVSMLAQAVSGTLEDEDEGEEQSRIRNLEKAIGAARARTDQVKGERISFKPVLDQLIRSLSHSADFKIDASLFKGNRIQLLEEAKQDFVLGLEAGMLLNDAFGWLFGNNVFGLKSAKWFRWKASAETQASVILLWAALKESDDFDTFGAAELIEFHRNATRINSESRRLQNVVHSNPRLENLFKGRTFKNAMKSEENFEKLLKRIKTETCI